jgi:hypothetical protein
VAPCWRCKVAKPITTTHMKIPRPSRIQQRPYQIPAIKNPSNAGSFMNPVVRLRKEGAHTSVAAATEAQKRSAPSRDAIRHEKNAVIARYSSKVQRQNSGGTWARASGAATASSTRPGLFPHRARPCPLASRSRVQRRAYSSSKGTLAWRSKYPTSASATITTTQGTYASIALFAAAGLGAVPPAVSVIGLDSRRSAPGP